MIDFEASVLKNRGGGRFFSATQPISIARAPGRLDLMGGNVDYTGGMVFQSTIREATWAAAQCASGSRIVFWNPGMKEQNWRDRVEFNLEDLTDDIAVKKLSHRDPDARWIAYVLGAFLVLRARAPEKVSSGVSIYIESEVPCNKGVSSSAAVEVAVMKALANCYDIPLQGVALAEACQWMENVIAESACGIMDQAASILGDEGSLLPIVCQPCLILPLVRLPPGLVWWAIDSGVRHEVTGREYESARAAAFVAYRMICEWEDLPIEKIDAGRIPRYADPKWRGFLSKLAPSVFRSKYECRLPELLSGSEILALGRVHPDPFTTIRPELHYRVRACARYAVEENQRVELFVALARAAEARPNPELFRHMGELMFQSHWSYTECGLGCEETDQLVDLVRQHQGEDGLFGAKITGGGSGGTVAVLGSPRGVDNFRKVVEEYGQMRSIQSYVFEQSSIGADRYGIRTIPGSD